MWITLSLPCHAWAGCDEQHACIARQLGECKLGAIQLTVLDVLLGQLNMRHALLLGTVEHGALWLCCGPTCWLRSSDGTCSRSTGCFDWLLRLDCLRQCWQCQHRIGHTSRIQLRSLLFSVTDPLPLMQPMCLPHTFAHT